MYSLPDISEYRRSSSRYVSLRLKNLSVKSYLPTLKSEPTSSTPISSKNLFTTVLKEETEEIIEEDFTPQARNMGISTFSSKLPRTMPNLDRYTLISKSELVEENSLREKHVEKYLKDLHRITSEQDYQLDIHCQYRERKSNCDLRDRIIRVSENILNLYNIRLHMIDLVNHDSLMKIQKIKDRFLLAKCLEILVQEAAKFPYSFFKKIGVSTLTFCQDIELFKEPNNPMIKQKLLTGLFPLNKLRNESEIIDYFYKVVFYHLKNKVPDLDDHWAKVYIKKSKTIMYISMNVVVKESTKPKKSFFDEQWRLFKDMILNPNKTLKNESNVIRNKAFKLKGIMESNDPDGINESWWKKKGFSLMVGSLDHI